MGFIDAITQVVDKEHDKYLALPYIRVSGKYGITDQIDAGIQPRIPIPDGTLGRQIHACWRPQSF